MSQDVKDKFRQLLEDMNNAKETPSENCAEGDMHDFQFLSHADGSDSYYNYFRCPNCREVIVQTHKRTGTNALLWAD